jgi:hypothetical protein
MLLEDTIHLPKIHPLFKGTVDFGFWSMSDGVFLRDYKNGEGIGVSAPGNKQLLYYGALMIFNIGRICRATCGCRSGSCSRISTASSKSRTCGKPRRFRARLGNERIAPAHECLTDRDIPGSIEDDFKPGGWCQFCPVLLDCPKMQSSVCRLCRSR